MDQASIEAHRQAIDVSRSRIAALCFLVWDVLITTDQEIQHIWLTPFQPLKLLYFFARYYSVIVLIVLNVGVLSCHGWILVEAVSAILLEISIEILLMLRIYAMYTGNKITIRTLLPAFVAQITIMIVSLAISLPRIMTSPGCEQTDFPVTIIAYSITSIVFEGFLFGLAMFRYWTAHNQGWEKVSLFQLLVRDNMWTFLIIFIANLTNTVLFTLAPTTFANMGFPFLLAIFGSTGPRLVLNVRQAHAKKTKSIAAESISSLSVSLPLIAYSPIAVFDPDTPRPVSSTTESSRLLGSPMRVV
ncbi:hypothetical protein BDY19DRAFT_132119 [Irpex rosettiformis]|uniref:Uncharacterized protein n=1 Tax=Irpex rosettiformis TaxID=378272 RepID=A0ACB8U4D7_9APHY|nr:hypothetical protein BDY19DRAFT_132119 [Irpex rosettiformis]